MQRVRDSKAKKGRPVGATTRGASRRQPSAERRWPQRLLRVGKLLGVVALVSTLVGGAGWFMVPTVAEVVNQPIVRVAVKGRLMHMPKEQVQVAMQPYLNSRFFTVDLDAMQADLLTLPWVQTVSLRRQWPGVIEISVTEQVPVARWQSGALLNSEGNSFVVENAADFVTLPHLIGPDSSEIEVMEQYQTLSNLLRPNGLNIRELRLTNRGSWELLTDDFVIMIGRSHVVDKIQRFVAVYDAALKDNGRPITKVDVRYLNGVAVAWGSQSDSHPLVSETVGTENYEG
ncbi:cell division protein FtsQ/DivIB [Aestuariirhabdus litorea]|uniref:Cell division protein FtsQ n=1 Tax=Aestuariirhabdus litorea TaxID=2528527 RepID=A0A3P3VXD0_9GAMM|nr:cell division protein FtsQ/DivIB [Aestuariirhabdus litorea]RRJ85343.1 cell division protein FtsQ [Aestuariirhabdus litorea]RWW98566.1 FtsQ-type POTRA domain-containing protein [Endozoicomonadaceae bacterium GTF-13]